MKKHAFKKLSAILAVAMIIAAIAPLSAQAAYGDKFTVGDFEFVVHYQVSGSTTGTVRVNNYKATGGDVVIPATVTNASNGNIYTVKYIWQRAFENKSITSVFIPSTVENITDRAFDGCASLIKVTFEPGSKLTNLGGYVFNGCISLKSINLPDSLEVINESAFKNCKSLESIDLPKGLSQITFDVFKGCSKLNEIIFNSPRVPYIPSSIFKGISSTGKIYYPENGSGYTDRFFDNLFDGGPVPDGWKIIEGRPPRPSGVVITPVNMSADVPKADVAGFGRDFSVSGEITNAPGVPESVKLNVNALSPEFTSNKAANAAYSDAVLHGQPVAFNALEVVDAVSGGIFALPEGAKAQLKFELGKAYADKAVIISQYDVNGALIERFNVTCDGGGSAVIQTRGLGLFVITREWI